MKCFSKKSFFICFFLLLVLYAIVFGVYFEKRFRIKNGYSFFFGNQPLISVVVTSYNYERYLTQTLDSIAAQTYKKYEVVIVDDGSKDNSVELIKKYTEKYPNFHLYQHENGINKGFPASVKLGVEKTKGEYIAFLESDDYWREDKLKEVVKMINRYSDAVIISNGVFPFTDEYDFNLAQTLIYLRSLTVSLDEKNKIFSDENEFLYNVIPSLSAVTIKRTVLVNLDFDTPNVPFLDIWLYHQILYNYPLYHIKKNLTFWRRHKNSLSKRLNKETSEEFVEYKFKKLIKDMLSQQKNSVKEKD